MPSRLHLASASPRRADLLRQLGLPFTPRPSAAPERSGNGPARETVLANACAKAEAAALHIPEGWILAADTLGEVEGRSLGKPRDADDAARILRFLSGRTHRVFTGVCVLRQPGHHRFTGVEATDVTFPPLSEETIRAYVKTGEPLDKAGAYALQGLGAALVAGIRGDYTNVVGLPLRLTLRLLHEAGYPLPAHLRGREPNP